MAGRKFRLVCRACRAPVAVYKKSGSGKLIRVYLDRIEDPADWQHLKGVTDKRDLPPLKCPGCGALLGMPVIDDGRPAWRLLPGTLGKTQ